MFSGPKKVRVALRWAPHPRALPQAVPNSFLQWMKSAEGIDIKAVYPEGYDLAPEFMDGVERSHDPNEGLRDVDVIYVKNWSKYEPYAEVGEVDQAQWMLSSDSMRVCPNARVMHCLPVRRNVVIEDTVLNSKNAVVQQQAHNRLWSAAAVLHEMLGGLA
jgi:N-succinyl-L-ornithine transcarbamylase